VPESFSAAGFVFLAAGLSPAGGLDGAIARTIPCAASTSYASLFFCSP
jgi:hypothetical protein